MTPITGSISLGNVRSELGASGPISLGSSNVRTLSGQATGAVSLGAARACAWIATNQENLNLFEKAASPATVANYRFVIASGVTVGGTAGSALLIGSFPPASNVTLDNYGSVLGMGGAGSSYYGNNGGTAIAANYANISMIVNNYGTVYGGGGQGGRGGTGGTGGTGGQGVYYTQNIQYNGGSFRWEYSECTNLTRGYWNGTLVYQASGNQTQGNGYYRGNYQGSSVCWAGDKGTPAQYIYYYQIWVYVANYTSGGAGGAGGQGGVGGRGQGYDGINTVGSTGSGGSPGSAGGTNAGSGGYGGTGGSGGTGGTYGNNGNTGGTGNAGATGNAGNYTGGSAGAAGGSWIRWRLRWLLFL